ncbi:MAG: thioredoxin family protein [Xanthobacteraceae bacterium]|nr:thioredoxin family protein [Xanthobacteraceae bacterium]
MKVELFHAPGCSACGAANAELRATAQEAVANLEWHEVDVAKSVDRAVELGVLTVPAIAIDDELVFTSMPTPSQLCQALNVRAKRTE